MLIVPLCGPAESVAGVTTVTKAWPVFGPVIGTLVTESTRPPGMVTLKNRVPPETPLTVAVMGCASGAAAFASALKLRVLGDTVKDGPAGVPPPPPPPPPQAKSPAADAIIDASLQRPTRRVASMLFPFCERRPLPIAGHRRPRSVPVVSSCISPCETLRNAPRTDR